MQETEKKKILELWKMGFGSSRMSSPGTEHEYGENFLQKKLAH